MNLLTIYKLKITDLPDTLFSHALKAIPQMCITAIANMQQNATKEGKPQSLFSKDNDIIPFIEQYWEAMTTMPRRVTQSW